MSHTQHHDFVLLIVDANATRNVPRRAAQNPSRSPFSGVPTLRGASTRGPAINLMTAYTTGSGSCSGMAVAAERATVSPYRCAFIVAAVP